MKEKLLNVLKNAYSPYYNFKVAAIVVTNDGNMFSGVNVENANGTSICAERNAIAASVASGYKKGDFKEIYVMLEKGMGTPCFACRQVLLEFMEMDKKVICMDTAGNTKVYKISDLCPYPFGSEDLKWEVGL